MAKDARRPVGQPPVSPPGWPDRIAGPIGELQKQVALHGARTPDEFMTSLSDVLHRSDEFLDLFGGTAWGHVVWKKEVGWPLSPKLADAFVFSHAFQQLSDKGINPDGSPPVVPEWKTAPAPAVWDGPHDDEHYRVSFMLHGQTPWLNGVGIDFDRSVSWEPRTVPWLDWRLRYIAYPPSLQQNAGTFLLDKDAPIDLDDFEVLWWPF